MPHIALTSAAAPDSEPPQCDKFPITSLGSLDAEQILLLGDGGADLMCALLRAGASQITHLRSCDRLEPDSASLVLVPHIPCLSWLVSALPAIRRALVTTGRLVLVLEDADSMVAHQVRRLLVQNGYIPVRISRFSGSLTVEAERPGLSLRRVA